jgi:ApbE superfamily uncharacterized protein (UPF0280 family)
MALNPRLQVAMLSGGRLHLHDGPIDLVIHADGAPDAVAEAYRAATLRAATVLDELCHELPLLRAQAGPGVTMASGDVARRMQGAVRPFQTNCFITPMAAVAGAVAEAVLEAMLVAPLARATVNNGGDIAIHLAPGQHLVAGLAARPERLQLFGRVRVAAEDEPRGIATSGFGGRSDTFGIADAVTILARSAAAADAAASIVANAVDLPGHSAIRRGPSTRAQSDLGDRPVTHAVGRLDGDEIDQALERGAAMARVLLQRGLVAAAALHLRGATRLVQSGDHFSLAAPTGMAGLEPAIHAPTLPYALVSRPSPQHTQRPAFAAASATRRGSAGRVQPGDAEAAQRGVRIDSVGQQDSPACHRI